MSFFPVLFGFRGKPAVDEPLRATVAGGFRALIEAVAAHQRALSQEIRATIEAASEDQPAEQRLVMLEQHRLQFEAECEALLMKAGGKMQAAANAEARTRTMKKSYETDIDPLAPDSEEAGATDEDIIAARNAEIQRAAGLQPLHVGMAKNDRTHALRAKWS